MEQQTQDAWGFAREVAHGAPIGVVELCELLRDWRRFAYVCRITDRITVMRPGGIVDERLVPSLRSPRAMPTPYVVKMRKGHQWKACLVDVAKDGWLGYTAVGDAKPSMMAEAEAKAHSDLVGVPLDCADLAWTTRKERQAHGLYLVHQPLREAHLHALKMMGEM